MERVCVICNKEMTEGFINEDNGQVWCSEKCLRFEYTVEEQDAAYSDGEGNLFWTTWEEDEVSGDSSRIDGASFEINEPKAAFEEVIQLLKSSLAKSSKMQREIRDLNIATNKLLLRKNDLLLSVRNSHQNTLDSFNLFLSTLPDSEFPNAKNSLVDVVEVPIDVLPKNYSESDMKKILLGSKNILYPSDVIIHLILYRAFKVSMHPGLKREWFSESDLEIHELALLEGHVMLQNVEGNGQFTICDVYVNALYLKYASSNKAKWKHSGLTKWARKNGIRNHVRRTTRIIDKQYFSLSPKIEGMGTGTEMNKGKYTRTYILESPLEKISSVLRTNV